jgi:carbonic anhydrase/acetyltransferase-like protein (isoleucine patch superfamily)
MPPTARLHGGLILPHPQGIVSRAAVAGPNHLGDNVMIGANAVVQRTCRAGPWCVARWPSSRPCPNGSRVE